MATANLWPNNLRTEKSRGMRQILLDTGIELADLTDGKLVLEVETYPERGRTIGGVEYTHLCSIRAPSPGFALPLFNVHSGSSPFPARVYSAEGHQFEVSSEAELREGLSKVYHSPRTREVILSLLSNID